MSQAEELLNSLSDGEVAGLYTADPDSEPHIVIGIDRIVTVPAALRKIGVQYDHNIETVVFDCPRYWDGHDLSSMALYINYTCADGYDDCNPVDNLRVDEDDDSMIHFEWTLSANATRAVGVLEFNVCARKTGELDVLENHWSSEINRDMVISKGKDCNEAALDLPQDLVTALLTRQSNVEIDMADTREDMNAMLIEAEELIHPELITVAPEILESNKEYNFGEVAELNLVFPSTAESGDIIYLTFMSGATPTTLTIDITNTCDIEVVPEVNTGYEIFGKFNGDIWVVNYDEYTVSEV